MPRDINFHARQVAELFVKALANERLQEVARGASRTDSESVSVRQSLAMQAVRAYLNDPGKDV